MREAQYVLTSYAGPLGVISRIDFEGTRRDAEEACSQIDMRSVEMPTINGRQITKPEFVRYCDAE